MMTKPGLPDEQKYITASELKARNVELKDKVERVLHEKKQQADQIKEMRELLQRSLAWTPRDTTLATQISEYLERTK